jgi:ADP-ribosylglycohydrolase
MDKLKVLTAGKDVAFFEPPQSCFYAYPQGRSSPYGEQALVVLASIVDCNGFSPQGYAAANFVFYASTGPESPTSEGRGGVYLDGSTNGFLRNVRRGLAWPGCGTVGDDQANALARLPALVAALCGSPDLLPSVAALVRVTQESEVAVAYGCAAARILEAIILGSTPTKAVADALAALRNPARAFPTAEDAAVVASLEMVMEHAATTHAAAVAQLGRNCHLPGSFMSPLHALLALETYDDAVKATIAQGGCNASRAGFVGACFGAWKGPGAVPIEWAQKFDRYEETIGRAQALVGLRI